MADRQETFHATDHDIYGRALIVQRGGRLSRVRPRRAGPGRAGPGRTARLYYSADCKWNGCGGGGGDAATRINDGGRADRRTDRSTSTAYADGYYRRLAVARATEEPGARLSIRTS